jgi:hypothetical protein
MFYQFEPASVIDQSMFLPCTTVLIRFKWFNGSMDNAVAKRKKHSYNCFYILRQWSYFKQKCIALILDGQKLVGWPLYQVQFAIS